MSKVLLLLIRVYQMSRPFRPDTCRFYPSCSTYAAGCLGKHGFWQGSILTFWRILRCQPFSRGGIDDVPEVFNVGVFRSFISKRV